MNASYLGTFILPWICIIKCLRGSFMPPSVTVWHLRNIWQRGLCHSRRWWRESGFTRSANTQACSGRATWPAQSLYLPPCHLLLTGHHQSSLDQGHSGTLPPPCAAFQNTNRQGIQEVFCDSHEWGAGQRRKSACVRGDKSAVVASITTFQLPAGWTLGWGEWSKWSGFE